MLKKHMEDHRLSAAAACATAAAMAATPAQFTAPPVLGPAASLFSITLRKADGVSLGLSVTANEEGKALIVEAIVPGGAVESWNRQFVDDCTGERVVVPGDRIVRVNGIEKDVARMLEACTTQRLVKLLVARGPGGTRARMAADGATQQLSARPGCEVGAAAQQAAAHPPWPSSALRSKAPEFVPPGVEPTPLQPHQAVPLPTQHLSTPPGLFSRPEDYATKKLPGAGGCESGIKAAGPAATTISNAYGEVGRAQDGGDDDEADKEN